MEARRREKESLLSTAGVEDLHTEEKIHPDVNMVVVEVEAAERSWLDRSWKGEKKTFYRQGEHFREME